MSAPEKNCASLMSPLIERPLTLLLTGVIPQIVLVGLNLWNYDLICGEMTPAQSRQACDFFVGEVLLTIFTCGVVFYLRQSSRSFTVGWAGACLGLNLGYLWYAVSIIDGDLIPSSVGWWMLNPGDLIGYQFTFIMPGLFHAALRLAFFPARLSRRKDLLISGATALIIPGLWYISTELSRHMGWMSISETVLMVLLVGSTLLLILAFIRFLGLVFTKLNAAKHKTALLLVVGIITPVAGLALNIAIPFPVNLQDWLIYLLAIVNGLVLMIPSPKNEMLRRLVMAARAGMFPFTLYFFLVFLPYMPLSIPAMIVMGAGFLILAPTALFFVHSAQLAEDWRIESSRNGRLTAAALIILPVLIMPSWFVGEAYFDRTMIDRAIRFAFESNYRNSKSAEISATSISRCLGRLRNWKRTERLPYLAGAYQWIVFDNLSLPDEKMDKLHRIFCGSPIPVSGKETGFFSRTREESFFQQNPAPEIRNIELKKITQRHDSIDEEERTTVTMEILGGGSTGTLNEWVCQIDVPPAAQISKNWLWIGNERVPGRIFERKSAIWIYTMIRTARRDPSLLLWTKPGHLELRVFPVASGETRTVEIEFSLPTGFGSTALIDGRKIKLGKTSSTPQLASIEPNDTSALLMANSAAAKRLPQVKRTPYLHFIIDRSVETPKTLDDAVRRCSEIAGKFPNANHCIVTLANYESLDLTAGAVPVSSLQTIELRGAEKKLPRQGGFCRDRALKRAILLDHDRFTESTNHDIWFLNYPMYIIVRQSTEPIIRDEHLAWFSLLTPDVDGFWQSDSQTNLLTIQWDGVEKPAGEAVMNKPVYLMRWGGKNICASTATETPCLSIPSKPPGEPEFFDSVKNIWIGNQIALNRAPQSSRLTRGADAWSLNLALFENPSLMRENLPSVVQKSRDSGTLTPSTAYIVVENSAQWKLLERKEKQKLRNAEALEVSDVPEPSTWILLAGLAAFAGWRKYSSCRRTS